MTQTSLSLVFEFARTNTPENPHAFRYGPQDYTLRTTHGGRKRVHLDWSDELLHDLDALHQPYCDPAVAQRIGRVLCAFLEPAGWSWHARAICDSVQQGSPVVVTVRSAAAEIYALPWELLPLEATGQCVGELPGVLVHYEWPETHTVPLKHAAGPQAGRVLAAWSAAGGTVPAAEHVDAIQASCHAAGQDFHAERDVLPNVSIGKLADALERAQTEQQPVSVLHLLCHGGNTGKTQGLLLHDEGSIDSVVVDAWRLRQLLAPHASTLRLVVVLACGTAHGREFDSVAQALHRAGIQNVVASRFPLSVPGSVRIAQTLYELMLIHRRSLEIAFLKARKQLARDAARLDWAGLQLYSRQADGHDSYPLDTACHEPTAGTQVEPPVELDACGLPTLLVLQSQVASMLASRFEARRALVCVELTELDFLSLDAYESRPHERCYGLLAEASMPVQGRIFETRGDSLRACYPSVKSASRAIFAFIDGLTTYNYSVIREEQLLVRIGLHYGPVLTNDKIVTGPHVELTARIAEAARSSEILVSKPALQNGPRMLQVQCRPVAAVKLDVSGKPLEVLTLPWRDAQRLPSSVFIEEMDAEIPLPQQDIIAFGRLDTLADGTQANDIVLTHSDERAHLSISRRHFELRRARKGYVLRAVSTQRTIVDGRLLERNGEVLINTGTIVRVADVLTLHFRGLPNGRPVQDLATVQDMATVIDMGL